MKEKKLNDSFKEFIKSNAEASSANEFFQNWIPYALIIAMGFTKKLADAEDLVQEVAFKILRIQKENPEYLSMIENVAAWTYTCIKLRFLTDVRNDKRRTVLLKELVSTAYQDGELIVENMLEQEYLVKIIRSLSSSLYQNILLLSIEGYSHKEISEVLAIEKDRIRKLKYRARKALEKKLKAMKVDM